MAEIYISLDVLAEMRKKIQSSEVQLNRCKELLFGLQPDLKKAIYNVAIGIKPPVWPTKAEDKMRAHDMQSSYVAYFEAIMEYASDLQLLETTINKEVDELTPMDSYGDFYRNCSSYDYFRLNSYKMEVIDGGYKLMITEECGNVVYFYNEYNECTGKLWEKTHLLVKYVKDDFGNVQSVCTINGLPVSMLDDIVFGGKYGADQGVFGTTEFIEEALKEGSYILKVFNDAGITGYATQKEYLQKMDSSGCGYIGHWMAIYMLYRGRESQFRNDYGIDMYEVNEDGTLTSNIYKLAVKQYVNYFVNHKGSLLQAGDGWAHGDPTIKLEQERSITELSSNNVISIEQTEYGYITDATVVDGVLNQFKNRSENEEYIISLGSSEPSNPEKPNESTTDYTYYANPDDTVGTTNPNKHMMFITNVDVKNGIIEVSSCGKKEYLKRDDIVNGHLWMYVSKVTADWSDENVIN